MTIEARRSCVIATTPRTGSWLLAEGLHATGLAGEPQEYFGWEGFARWSEEFGLTTQDSHLRFVQEAISYGTTENGIFSTKLHWSQLERFVSRVMALPGQWPDSPGDILKAFFPDVHCVHLWRADTARQAISYWRAVQAGEWWDNGSAWPSKSDPVELDLQQIRWCEDLLVKQDDEWSQLLEQSRIPTMEVVYEAFVDNQPAVVEGILDFLQVPHDRITLPPSGLRRQSDAQTEDWLREYRLVREELSRLPDRWRWAGTSIEALSD